MRSTYRRSSSRSTARSTGSRSTTADPSIASDVAAGTGSSSARNDTLRPMPTTTAVPTTSVEDAAELAVADEDVVGPLQPYVELAERDQRPGHGEPGEQRQPAPTLRREGRAQQHREGQPGARRGRPGPVRRPRPAVCDSATTTSPSGDPSRAAAATSALVDGELSTTRTSAPQPVAGDECPAQGRSAQRWPVEILERAGHALHGTEARRPRGGAPPVTSLSSHDRFRRSLVGPRSRTRSTSTRPPASSPTCTGATTRRCTPARRARWRSSTPRAR